MTLQHEVMTSRRIKPEDKVPSRLRIIATNIEALTFSQMDELCTRLSKAGLGVSSDTQMPYLLLQFAKEVIGDN